MNQIGCVLASHGGGIVTVDHREDRLVVTGIEQLAFDFGLVADRIAALDGSEPKDSQFVIDSEGLGSALWATLPEETPKTRDRFALYEGHGLERQALVDGLVVAIHADLVRFVAGLEHQEAMTKALLSYQRQVKEDGQIGSELVVALCIAISERTRRPRHIAFLA